MTGDLKRRSWVHSGGRAVSNGFDVQRVNMGSRNSSIESPSPPRRGRRACPEGAKRIEGCRRRMRGFLILARCCLSRFVHRLSATPLTRTPLRSVSPSPRVCARGEGGSIGEGVVSLEMSGAVDTIPWQTARTSSHEEHCIGAGSPFQGDQQRRRYSVGASPSPGWGVAGRGFCILPMRRRRSSALMASTFTATRVLFGFRATRRAML